MVKQRWIHRTTNSAPLLSSSRRRHRTSRHGVVERQTKSRCLASAGTNSFRFRRRATWSSVGSVTTSVVLGGVASSRLPSSFAWKHARSRKQRCRLPRRLVPPAPRELVLDAEEYLEVINLLANATASPAISPLLSLATVKCQRLKCILHV